jgi:hypothetical protein
MVIFDNKKYAENENEFTNSLFDTDGTCVGYAKRLKNSIKLYDHNKNIILQIAREEIRTFDSEGFVNDGLGGIRSFDVFRTKSGRLTKPYPRQKSEKYTIEWLINEAIIEAKENNDEFILFQFENISLVKRDRLTLADVDMINNYLW